VYVADLQTGGSRLTNPTRLTLDEGWNNPFAWTADGKAVVFSSTRNGASAIFKQSLGQDVAEPFIIPKENEDLQFGACLTPQGSSILYAVRPKTEDPRLQPN